MARKKSLKAKEPVRIRFKKLANGNQSIYLDTYVNKQRTYDFLKLYIVPETSEAAKVANANALQAAKAIQAQRILDIANGVAHIRKDYGKMLLTDWLKEYQKMRKLTGQSGSRAVQIGNAIKHIETYNGKRKITLADVDADYCKGFINYLATARNRNHTKTPKTLSKKSGESYFGVLASALIEAKRQQIIPSSPIDLLGAEDRKPIKGNPAEIGYLTADEVEALRRCNFPTLNPVLKKVFLFACFTGFRISDIKSLKWGDIQKIGDTYQIHKLMMKTRHYVDVPLSDAALCNMPNRGDAQDTDNVFPTAYLGRGKDKKSYALPSTESGIDKALKVWADKAGLKKHVTFHMSRHTFATMLITQGADLYTVSKLLGHTDVSTTQIYAELVGKKKREAVELLNSVFK